MASPLDPLRSTVAHARAVVSFGYDMNAGWWLFKNSWGPHCECPATGATLAHVLPAQGMAARQTPRLRSLLSLTHAGGDDGYVRIKMIGGSGTCGLYRWAVRPSLDFVVTLSKGSGNGEAARKPKLARSRVHLRKSA